MELIEAPDVPIDPTPLITEYIAARIRNIMQVVSGYVLANTNVDAKLLHEWNDDTTKLIVSLFVFWAAGKWSAKKLQQQAKMRNKLARVVLEQKTNSSGK